MPFNFYHKERIAKLVERLRELRYREFMPIESFQTYEDDGQVGLRQPEKQDAGVIKTGERWGGTDKYLWLCCRAEFPDHWPKENVLGIFDLGETGGGNNSKFESLMYVNDQPYQALDSNHQEVFFDLDETGRSFDVRIRLWSGLNGGGKTLPNYHDINRAQWAVMDHYCDKFYYLSWNVLRTLDVLEDSSPSKERLGRLLVNSFKKVDFSYECSDAFYQSVEEAYNYLVNVLDQDKKMDVDVSLIGHTHIDVAWLWRLRHTREKCARSFSSVNRLMERYPYYKFVQTQAQLYDYIKEDYPDIYEMIKRRVAEGKWEPAGAMWVECDCNVTSGESLVRQVLYGKRYFENEFGYINDYLWLPDVFGYSWALPQILKKSGIKTFVTTKISWNDTNTLPYDTFKWRGIDGSEVTTHFVTTPSPWNSDFYTYNGDITPFSVKGIWDNYANKEINSDMLISYGHGDGGGGVDRNMLESIESIEHIEGLPRIKTEFVKDYLDRLNDTLDENPHDAYLPVWDGELYLEFHRGTYTSQAYNKKTNRQLEFLARDTELLCSIAMMKTGFTYPQQAIYDAWKIILTNQFHDIIPGSSIHEVYEDCHVDYAQAEKLLRGAMQSALDALGAVSDTYTVFNPYNWRRDAIVQLPDGQEVLMKDIPPMSSAVVPAASQAAMQPLNTDRGIENAHYAIQWNAQGHLTSVYDKLAEREIIPAGSLGNVFQVFEDIPRQYDAWELESTFEDKMDIVDQLMAVDVHANDLYTQVTFQWKYKKTTIKQYMKLYHHTHRIDFETDMDWQEREKIIKVAFPVDVRATYARYDIQFGSIVRPITRNTSWEQAKFEVVAHKWVDLSETGFGVSLMNDCKYGYDVKDGVVRLSLLKASNHPDYNADQGQHQFTYSIIAHTDEWHQTDLEKHAYEINCPMVPMRNAMSIDQFIHVDQDNIVIDTVKRAEDSDDVLIRFHEYKGAREQVTLTVNADYSSWCETDMMEKPIMDESTDPIVMTVKPFEIKTLLIKQ